MGEEREGLGRGARHSRAVSVTGLGRQQLREWQGGWHAALCSLSVSLPFLPPLSDPAELPPPPLCVFTCLLRWSPRMKQPLHTGAGEALRRCGSEGAAEASRSAWRLPQKSQLHMKGRSPVRQRRCALR